MSTTFSLGGDPQHADVLLRTGERSAPPRPETSSAGGGFPDREALLRDVEVLRAAAGSSESRPDVLLDLADALVWLGEYREALEALDRYAEAGGADPRAEDLRCWSRYAAKRSKGEPGAAGGGVYEIGGAVEAPLPKLEMNPRTIALLERLDTQGPLHVRMIIDEKGRVACARDLEGGGRHSDSALHLARTGSYKPAVLDGVAVPVYYDTSYGLLEGSEARRLIGPAIP